MNKIVILTRTTGEYEDRYTVNVMAFNNSADAVTYQLKAIERVKELAHAFKVWVAFGMEADEEPTATSEYDPGLSLGYFNYDKYVAYNLTTLELQ